MQRVLSMEEVREAVLGWDLAAVRSGKDSRGARPQLTRVPTRFQSFQQYTQIFKGLLLEELREQIHQVSTFFIERFPVLGVFFSFWGVHLPCSRVFG